MCACRMQRDQAAHFHASNKQVGDELVESQAELSQQASRTAREGERRRHLEALLEEGLQVQHQILLGLQVCHHLPGQTLINLQTLLWKACWSRTRCCPLQAHLNTATCQGTGQVCRQQQFAAPLMQICRSGTRLCQICWCTT